MFSRDLHSVFHIFNLLMAFFRLNNRHVIDYVTVCYFMFSPLSVDVYTM